MKTGAVMRRGAVAAALVGAVLCGCTARQPRAVPVKPDAVSLLPGQYFRAGWRRQEHTVTLYGPANLYDYINGAAEMFHGHGFKRLATATYVRKKDENEVLTVDIYEMGSPLDAYGIYSRYRDPEGEFPEIGAAACLSGNTLVFCKESYFVQLQTIKLSLTGKQALGMAAREAAGRIPGRNSLPPELGYLPGNAVREQTIDYVPRSLLGYGFLPGGIQASYGVEGEEKDALLFIALCGTPGKASEAFREYAQELQSGGRSFTPRPGPGEESFEGDDAHYGPVLVSRYREFLVGLIGLRDAAVHVSLLEAALQSIKSSAGD